MLLRTDILQKPVVACPCASFSFLFCFLAAWVSIKTFKQNDKTVTINHENEHHWEKTFSYLCSCSAIALNNSQEHAGLKNLILYVLSVEELDCKAYSKKIPFTISSDEGLSTWSLIDLKFQSWLLVTLQKVLSCAVQFSRLGLRILTEMNSSIGKTCKA